MKRGGPAEAVEALLKSLPVDGEAFQEIAWRWAGAQVRAGREAKAVRVLKRVKGDGAARLAQALEAPRVGHYALVSPGDDVDRVGLRAGYDLAQQRPVLLRLGAPADSAAVVAQGQLQAALCLPGVCVAWDAGVGDRGTPYVSLPPGPAGMPPRLKALSPAEALRLAWDGVRILHALAAVGVVLPGADPGRFRLLPGRQLELVDLAGAREARVSEALQAHQGLAAQWVGRALAWPPLAADARPRREVSEEVRALLDADDPPGFSRWGILAS